MTSPFSFEPSEKKQETIVFYEENTIGWIQQSATQFEGFPRNTIELSFDIAASTEISAAILSSYLEKEDHCYVSFAEFSDHKKLTILDTAGFVEIVRYKAGVVFAKIQKNVRLSVPEIIAIEAEFQTNFLQNDELWIFGSRTDLSKKGGDIDIWIKTYASSIDEGLKQKELFLSAIEKRMGRQKIDCVVFFEYFPHSSIVHEEALKKGVRLV